MSFIEELFDDNKKMGSIFILSAFLSAILAILTIVLSSFINGLTFGVVLIVSIGTFICAFLYYQFGIKVRDGSNDRVTIFSGIVRLDGLVWIVIGIFVIASLVYAGFGIAGGTGIFFILIGLVFLWASSEIAKAGGNHGFMWILLVILFVLSLLGGLMNLVAGLAGLDLATAIQGLIGIVIAGYALYLAFSQEVKIAMGA
jgi:hypothetical protein